MCAPVGGAFAPPNHLSAGAGIRPPRPSHSLSACAFQTTRIHYLICNRKNEFSYFGGHRPTGNGAVWEGGGCPPPSRRRPTGNEGVGLAANAIPTGGAHLRTSNALNICTVRILLTRCRVQVPGPRAQSLQHLLEQSLRNLNVCLYKNLIHVIHITRHSFEIHWWQIL